MLKTNDYSIFKFRNDNREKIDQRHVERLRCSIESKNLLSLRPISVNKDYEVIDGQHRLLAAKALQVEIYYNVEDKLNSSDIILMNLNKAWGWNDYLNYYCKNGSEHYIKLKEFVDHHKISLKIALNITMGGTHESYENFRNGKYTFDQGSFGESINICWETIDEIKKLGGYTNFTSSARFWKAMVTMIKHPGFEEKVWKERYPKMIGRFSVRTNIKEYLRMFMDIYNYRNHARIDLLSTGF